MTTQAHPLDLTESRALYDACRSRDAEVQHAAFRALWPYLYRRAYHLLRDQTDADALAQDCAQIALERVYQRLIECQEPAAFRTWARRIVSNLAIDELRRRQRLVDLPDEQTSFSGRSKLMPTVSAPEQTVLAQLSQHELSALLDRAPISDRSRRLVVGRYLDGLPDEQLAQTESEQAGTALLPSHIQVTRAKNMSKLRSWDLLIEYLSAA